MFAAGHASHRPIGNCSLALCLNALNGKIYTGTGGVANDLLSVCKAVTGDNPFSIDLVEGEESDDPLFLLFAGYSDITCIK